MKSMGAVGAIWGIFGFALLLVWVLIRLTPLAIEATEYEWTMLQWLVLIVNTGLMAYLEGYRGFQLPLGALYDKDQGAPPGGCHWENYFCRFSLVPEHLPWCFLFQKMAWIKTVGRDPVGAQSHTSL